MRARVWRGFPDPIFNWTLFLMTAAPTIPGSDPDLAGTSPIKRQQIIEGASRIFIQHGFEGASMSQIARDAQVSKGTLYNYFESKSALFIETVRQMTCQKLPLVYGIINDYDHDPERALTELGRTIVSFQLSDSIMAMYRTIVAEGVTFPELAESFWENGPARSIERLSRWLADKTQQGAFAVDDPVLAAEQFISLCQTRIGIRRRFNLPVDSSPEAVDLVIHGAVRVFMKAYARPV